jgi:hypothetical protein
MYSSIVPALDRIAISSTSFRDSLDPAIVPDQPELRCNRERPARRAHRDGGLGGV